MQTPGRSVKQINFWLIAGVVAVCIGVAALLPRPDDGVDEVASGGTTVPSVPLNTDPFEMAEADSNGSTTLPSEMFGTDANGRPITTTTTSGVPNLPPPSNPELPATSAVSSPCGMSRFLASLGTLRGRSPAEVGQVTAESRVALDAYRDASPPQLIAVINRVRTTVIGIIERIEASGNDIANPEIAAELDRVANGEGEFAPFVADVAEIATWEQTACD